MATFFISDTHFGHKNAMEKIRNMSVEEGNALIIKNWNNTINKYDKVFLVGDVTMDKPDIIREIIPQLNGSIHVILGNHDTPRCVEALIETGCKVAASEEYGGYLITHIPVDVSQIRRYKGNIHGHIHCPEVIWEPTPKYFNVNCEMHDYTPISFEEIERIHKERVMKELYKECE